MTGGKGLDALEVTQADPDKRREKEIAVLATLVKEGPLSGFFQTAFAGPYMSEALDFHFPDLGVIAKAIWDLAAEGVKADPLLVAQRAKGMKISEDKAREILDGANAKDPTVAGEFIKDLVTLETYRKSEAIIQQAGAYLQEAQQNGQDGREAVLVALKGLDEMAHDEKRGVFKRQRSEAEEIPGFLEELENRRKDGRNFIGLQSCFDHLDEVLNGLSGLTVLAAMPSAGKTSLAKQIADQVAEKEKVPVLFFTFEQSAEELRIKSLARLSEVNSRRIQKGRTTKDPEAWQDVKATADKYKKGPGQWLKIIEADATFTPETIRNIVRAEMRQANASRVLVVIDYLQLVPATDPNGKSFPSVRERVDYVLSALRRISRDLGAAVLAVSSMSRAGYKRDEENKKPSFEYLKESGGIEYSADVVIMLKRDYEESKRLTDIEREKAEKDQVDKKGKELKEPLQITKIEAHVVKNRNGELRMIPFHFIPSLAEFSEEGRGSDLEDESPF